MTCLTESPTGMTQPPLSCNAARFIRSEASSCLGYSGSISDKATPIGYCLYSWAYNYHDENKSGVEEMPMRPRI